MAQGLVDIFLPGHVMSSIALVDFRVRRVFAEDVNFGSWTSGYRMGIDWGLGFWFYLVLWDVTAACREIPSMIENFGMKEIPVIALSLHCNLCCSTAIASGFTSRFHSLKGCLLWTGVFNTESRIGTRVYWTSSISCLSVHVVSPIALVVLWSLWDVCERCEFLLLDLWSQNVQRMGSGVLDSLCFCGTVTVVF